MKRISAGLVGVLAICVIAVWAQAPAVSDTSVVKFDPAMDQLVSPSANLETLKNEFFGLVEGPVWVQDGQQGYLLFSDMPANCIYKWQDGKLTVFLEKSGFTGTDKSNVGFQYNNGRFEVIDLGFNGLTLDPQGRLVMAQLGDRRVVRLEKDGTRTVMAERYDGKRFNSPNDLIVKSNGSLIFSDPSSGLRGGPTSPQRELPVHGIYLVNNGTVTMLDNDPEGQVPNGIAFSPDEKLLYATSFRKLVVYDVKDDDTVANRRVFFNYDTLTKDSGFFDGIKVDTKGNIWGPGPGGIWAISPAGKALGRILVPEAPTNLAFGDADGKTLYITARRGLYRIRLIVSGIRPGPRQ